MGKSEFRRPNGDCRSSSVPQDGELKTAVTVKYISNM